MTLWPICLSFVNNSWKNRITTSINQCSLTRFQTNLCHQYGILWAELQTSLSRETSLVGRSKERWTCINRPVVDPGEGPRGPTPLIVRPNWGLKGWKTFFWDCRPPYFRVWMTGSPLICRSGPPLQAIMVERLTCQVLFSESVKLVFTFFPERHVHIICVQESEVCFLVSWVSFFLLSCWSTFLPAAVLKEPWTILLGKMFQKNSIFIR